MKNKKSQFLFCTWGIILTISSMLSAQTLKIKSVVAEDEKQHEHAINDLEYGQQIPVFDQWGDNELYFEYNRNPDTTEHIDASLGFRYLMLDAKIPKKDELDYTFALAYQAGFDFFAGTRESGPVVSTRNNPSLVLAIIRNPKYHKLTDGYFSVEHESNGQVSNSFEDLIDVQRSFQRDYRNNDEVTFAEITEMSLQTISRSNNFVALGFNYQTHLQSSKSCDNFFGCVNIFSKLRYQLNTGLEDQIWWDAERFDDRLKDYQGTLIEFESTFSSFDIRQTLRLSFRTGQLFDAQPFKNNTLDAKYYIDLPLGKVLASMGLEEARNFVLPMVIRYHNGYVEELYKYSDKTSFWAIGVHARY